MIVIHLVCEQFSEYVPFMLTISHNVVKRHLNNMVISIEIVLAGISLRLLYAVGSLLWLYIGNINPLCWRYKYGCSMDEWITMTVMINEHEISHSVA